MKRRKLSEYQFDPANANQHTERGETMLDNSIAEVGAGRSLVSDRNDTLAAGNLTKKKLLEAGIEDVIEVETDGKTVVVVKRTDFDLTDPDPNNKARRYAYYDNRSSEVSLDWDAEQILADMQAGLNFDSLFDEWELERFELDTMLPDDDDWGEAFGRLPDRDRDPFQQITFTLHDSQIEIVKLALGQAKQKDFSDSPNQNSNGNALHAICEAFLHGAS